ncbi:glycosyltransferase family 4 protein [Flavobacteriaceae bacterium]|nr:glycosyltransferase family 4 protein [Flavobacteriaceae bacterium]
MTNKILFVANVDWFFISHRLIIAKEAMKKGFEVFVACQDTGRSHEISESGIKFINLSISRSGTNPISELITLFKVYEIYNDIKPDIVHHITLKPVIYGTLMSRLLKVKGVVNAVSGLGYSFTANRKGLVQKVIIQLLKIGFNRNNLSIIFQNDDDKKAFEALDIISDSNRIIKIKGSGVDLTKFIHSSFPSFDVIKILLPTRMLWDKGVKELRIASEILKEKYKNKVQIILCGLADLDNKAGVSPSYLEDWQDGSYVKWIGYQKDMVKVYQDSHIVVLPSYREGMPKTLIEACAIGRAIVTTDAIGCNECVDEGINGLKVPIYSTVELASAIEKLILNSDMILQMGNSSRKKAVKEFDVNDVISKHLKIYSLFNLYD